MSLSPAAIRHSHDATSPSSQRILSLLQSRIKPIGEGAGRTTIPHKPGASSDASPASEYLRSASSALSPSSSPFELEVVDRRKATPDQWNTIGSYLNKSKRSQIEMLKDEQGAILVDWDDGQALQTEDAVRDLLNQLTKDKETSKGGSWWQRLTS